MQRTMWVCNSLSKGVSHWVDLCTLRHRPGTIKWLLCLTIDSLAAHTRTHTQKERERHTQTHAHTHHTQTIKQIKAHILHQITLAENSSHSLLSHHHYFLSVSFTPFITHTRVCACVHTHGHAHQHACPSCLMRTRLVLCAVRRGGEKRGPLPRNSC